MADYYKDTGSSGQMRIRVTSTTVEFWLNANSTTYAYDLPWRFYRSSDGWSSYREFSFTGGAWRKLGQVTATVSGTYGFGIGDSGTNGLGGPTSFTVAVDRVEAPPAPYLKSITSYDQDSAFVNIDSNGNGGGSIDRWQIGYGTSSSSPQSYKDAALSNGATTITSLSRGRTYYFWGRGHNEKGWSPWSNRRSITTWDIPDPPAAPAVTDVKFTSAHVKFYGGNNNGSPATEAQVGYGTSSSSPQTIVNGSDLDINGLNPGTKYYFWARTKNAVGWSAWSASSNVTTPAGAWVFYDGAWRRAVPYVKVSGVWKVAEPWVKIGGLWKNTF